MVRCVELAFDKGDEENAELKQEGDAEGTPRAPFVVVEKQHPRVDKRTHDGGHIREGLEHIPDGENRGQCRGTLLCEQGDAEAGAPPCRQISEVDAQRAQEVREVAVHLQQQKRLHKLYCHDDLSDEKRRLPRPMQCTHEPHAQRNLDCTLKDADCLYRRNVQIEPLPFLRPPDLAVHMLNEPHRTAEQLILPDVFQQRSVVPHHNLRQRRKGADLVVPTLDHPLLVGVPYFRHRRRGPSGGRGVACKCPPYHSKKKATLPISSSKHVDFFLFWFLKKKVV